MWKKTLYRRHNRYKTLISILYEKNTQFGRNEKKKRKKTEQKNLEAR